jgi:beta-galactosidase
MACGWTSEEISKLLPSGWTANPDGQTCYLSAGFFSFFRRRAPVEQAMFSSNCDHFKIYVDGKSVAEADPDREQFPHLRYAPFTVDLSKAVSSWGDLRVEGYIQDRQLIVKSFSGKGMDQAFEVLPDDATLFADGADTTRVVFRVTDEFGAIRPFSNDPIQLDLEGPAALIGDNPFTVVGGTGAVWIRAKEQPGSVRLTATHPVLGKKQVQIELVRTFPETV